MVPPSPRAGEGLVPILVIFLLEFAQHGQTNVFHVFDGNIIAVAFHQRRKRLFIARRGVGVAHPFTLCGDLAPSVSRWRPISRLASSMSFLISLSCLMSSSLSPPLSMPC